MSSINPSLDYTGVKGILMPHGEIKEFKRFNKIGQESGWNISLNK